MKLRQVLVSAPIDDQTVAGLLQAKLLYQALRHLQHLEQQPGIFWLQISQAEDEAPGYDQDVQGVGGAGVVKGQQGIALAQAVDGDGEAHVGKHPGQEGFSKTGAGESKGAAPDEWHGEVANARFTAPSAGEGQILPAGCAR